MISYLTDKVYILQIKCICHSLSLAIEKAFDKLPCSMGYLLHEIPKWFSKSSIRREEFIKLFNVMNGDGNFVTPPPFTKLCATRWLVRGKVLSRILSNWYELNAYFSCIENNCDSKMKYKARELKQMTSDPVLFWYGHFALPVINEFEQLNSFFQHENADPDLAMSQLNLQRRSLLLRVFDSSGRQLSLENVDFGAKFKREVTNFLTKEKNSWIALEKLEKSRRDVSQCFWKPFRKLTKDFQATETFLTSSSIFHQSMF